jgi:hypothetical protein
MPFRWLRTVPSPDADDPALGARTAIVAAISTVPVRRAFFIVFSL